MTRKKIIWAVSLIVLVAVAAFLVAGLPVSDVMADSDKRYEKLKLFSEVLSRVERNYVEEVDSEELIYNAIKGMIKSLDPHSAFLEPRAYKEMQVDTKGEFGGLGIQISIRDGLLTIISPIEDTPAWRIGLKAADKIIKIDGEPTKDMTLPDAVSKMRGPKGTDVTLSIAREGMKGLKDYTITRDIIRVKSIKSRVIEGDIGYIKILQFQERTASDLGKAIKKLSKENINALVLDLRNNPGGLLNSAVDVSSHFLPKGRMVVYIKDRIGKRAEYLTNGPSDMFEKPMVVLVNQGSASASEIVAGSLKDWKRAVIMGVKTFGKGSVQSVVPLSDGSGLRLTTARYYTPNGISIQSEGIEPDIEVKLKASEGQEAHPVYREEDLERHLDNDSENAPAEGEGDKDTKRETAVLKAASEAEDNQLQRAVDLLKTWSIFKGIAEEEPEGVPASP